MSECLPDLPRYLRQQGGEWQGADHPDGPWRPIPAPVAGLPWPTDPPAAGQRQALSPAKAMLQAFAADKYGIWLRGDPSRIAAAIRALANHAGPSKHWHADDLRTIAAELEGADG